METLTSHSEDIPGKQKIYFHSLADFPFLSFS